MYRVEANPPDVRMKAASEAIKFETSSLSAIDSTAKVEQTYIVRMPEPCATLDEWKTKYVDAKPVDTANDAEWQQRLQEIKLIAETKKEGGQ